MITTSPRLQCRDEYLLDIFQEQFAIDSAIENPGDAIVAKAANKRATADLFAHQRG